MPVSRQSPIMLRSVMPPAAADTDKTAIAGQKIESRKRLQYTPCREGGWLVTET
jgi:hypothetical protein